ncbi:ribose transport ATP-binding protein RbsA [Candidatus Moduliflexus flocculans]|uniref:Ribose transport ATP-binding protein RbsA n=1 Tax=Candidatus Moduliflexus flocculans TaxID=1499966 RepID=A0A0S6VVL3_9BACT|nr:ribose transport ATP-binding protein RbsA [Candidatus Moduliflexus flocculans]
MSANILELHKITKQFPGVLALKDVDFQLRAGEVHALVGENGAGKSTLVKIITGVIAPTHGEIIYEGHPVAWHNPQESISRGIAAIYQDPAIFPDLNVAENIFMGHQPHSATTRRIHWRKLYAKTEELMTSLNINIKPTDKIRGLSIAERQLVEIAKALSINAKIVIMDEPTSALSISESEELFDIIRDLKRKGTSIIFISHRIDDIFTVADRVTALRDGQYVGTREIGQVTRDDLVQMMVGREVKNLFPKLDVKQGKELLRVEGLSRKGEFRNVSFQVREGEILGLYGLVGAGRTEVAKAIFGMNPLNTGNVFVDGQPVTIRSPRDAIALGIAYVPEDRDKEGIILNMDITANISLAILQEFCKAGWLDTKAEAKTALEYAQLVEVKAAGLTQKVLGLSGGNKQKVSLAKWLASKSKILMFDEPTKGIDVGAKASVHRFISELAAKGFAVIMISSELPEIMGMADRIFVMHEGLVKGYFPRASVNEQDILAAALADA